MGSSTYVYVFVALVLMTTQAYAGPPSELLPSTAALANRFIGSPIELGDGHIWTRAEVHVECGAVTLLVAHENRSKRPITLDAAYLARDGVAGGSVIRVLGPNGREQNYIPEHVDPKRKAVIPLRIEPNRRFFEVVDLQAYFEFEAGASYELRFENTTGDLKDKHQVLLLSAPPVSFTIPNCAPATASEARR